MSKPEKLIPLHGGYRKLKSFQVAQLAYRQLFARICRIAGVLIAASFFSNASAAELLPPGFRPLPLGVHALVGGKIVVRPGEVLDSGTIVIRDGLIKAVGKD